MGGFICYGGWYFGPWRDIQSFSNWPWPESGRPKRRYIGNAQTSDFDNRPGRRDRGLGGLGCLRRRRKADRRRSGKPDPDDQRRGQADDAAQEQVRPDHPARRAAASRPRTAPSPLRSRKRSSTPTRTARSTPRALPTCASCKLQATDTQHAEAACPKAIVGKGKTTVRVAFPESTPFSANGPLVVFNGGEKGGTTTLYIHAYVSVPAPTAIVTTVKIKKEHRGRYGLRSIASIPPIAGGSGSVTNFEPHDRQNDHLQGQEAELPGGQMRQRQLRCRSRRDLRRRDRSQGLRGPDLQGEGLRDHSTI